MKLKGGCLEACGKKVTIRLFCAPVVWPKVKE